MVLPVALVNDMITPADAVGADKQRLYFGCMTNAGDPTGVVTPTAKGVYLEDTSNAALYWASTAAAAGWKKLTP